MNIAKLAIKRPIFITCIVAIIVILGAISYNEIGLELMPDVSYPAVGVTTSYYGASPEEIEQLITKPLEDQLGAISGLKHITSENTEGLSSIMLEFDMSVNVDMVAQDVRDKVSIAVNSLPDDLSADPVVQKFDPSASAIIRLALISDLTPAEIYDLANETIKPKIERLKDIGNVQIRGGNRREIQIEIDQNKLYEYMIPMTGVVNQIQNSGSNIPIGSKEQGSSQMIFRAMGEFTTLDQIKNSLISFSGDVGNSVSVKTLGGVKDGIEDVKSIGYIYYADKSKKDGTVKDNSANIKSCIYLDIIKQSGKNTVSVADDVKKELKIINESLKGEKGNSSLIVASDQSEWIKVNVEETVSTIIIGIILAVLVVYLFLGNIRSTIITAIAIPNSMLGAVILMYVMGYTFNLMTLMALSLVVGLLVDDAIVVRENIFRKLEDGQNSFRAAENGTNEVMLAVIATTLAILAVFFPIGMLSGVIGKLFKQFGFTVVFAMIVSLFDALTVAPFLSAYFAGDGKKSDNVLTRSFEKFQVSMEVLYTRIMGFCLNHSLLVIGVTGIVFLSSIGLLGFVKKTFVSSGDQGEFAVSIEMPAGTSLQGTGDTIKKIEEKIKGLKDLDHYTVTVGSSKDEATEGKIRIFLSDDREKTTSEYKDEVRGMLSEFSYAHPAVNEAHGSGGGSAFNLVVSGHNLETVEKASAQILEQIKTIPDLVDVDTSMRKGSPEFRVNFNQERMQALGVMNSVAGTELRYNITGAVVGQFREKGIGYDVRARLKPDQRDLTQTFDSTKVANTGGRMVPLNSVATGDKTTGFAKISRKDKAYIVNITGNLAKNGAVGNAMNQAKDLIKKNVKLPSNVSYSFSGTSETFAETASSVVVALLLAIIFIYLVLSSLYESFITPFTILLAVPPALTGALLALFLTGFMLDLFSMIGMVMLMGIVTKNSILLVDNAVHRVNAGVDRKEAILLAGQRRLRPILMTTFAMLAGMLPLALGIGEAAQMRQSMGISIMGGIIVSTLITLIVVPAVFEYIDRFRMATESKILVREEDLSDDRTVNSDTEEQESFKNKILIKKKREQKK